MKELKPTTKMRKGIKMIEELLGIKYKGKTFDDASKFLEEYLPQIQGKDIREVREPSEKMLRGISFIQSMLHVEFTGKTMKEASEFISQYMDQAIKESERRKSKK